MCYALPFFLKSANFNGEQALGYVRMRVEESQQGAGRQRRRRDVIEALVNEVIGSSMLTRHQEILSAVEENFTKNCRFVCADDISGNRSQSSAS